MTTQAIECVYPYKLTLKGSVGLQGNTLNHLIVNPIEGFKKEAILLTAGIEKASIL